MNYDIGIPQGETESKPEEVTCRTELQTRKFDPRQELRVSIREHKKGPKTVCHFVTVRVWEQLASGSWYPTRRGINLSQHNIDPLIHGLQQALSSTRELNEKLYRERRRRNEQATDPRYS